MMEWSQTEPLDASRATINGDLRGARNKTMLEILGNPRGDYSEDCQDPTNPRIRALIVHEDVGPFRARGLRPAVSTLRTILSEVRENEPDIYRRLSSAGMLCCRFVRDSRTAISNHSWGCAIDLKIDRILDKRGDRRAQKGLLRIYRYFNQHKFFWGAAFPIEDAMHFEASEQLVREWQETGQLGDAPRLATASANSLIEFGDRGAEVMAVQQMLAVALGISIHLDGIFGAMTRAAVLDFQARNSLETDGVVGPKTLAALRAATAGGPDLFGVGV
jgi:hypothetical protein